MTTHQHHQGLAGPRNDQGYLPQPGERHDWQNETTYQSANDGYNPHAHTPSPVSGIPIMGTSPPVNSAHYQSLLQADPYMPSQQDYQNPTMDAMYAPKEAMQREEEQQPPTFQQPRQYYRNSLRKSWGMEMASTTLSILCLVAMVVILMKIDGRLLSSWKIAVSPNAVISVLSTASKAAMILPVAEGISQLKWLHLERVGVSLRHLQVFDDASRGPWGSLKFVWFARKAPHIAYLGCVVTIAAIALDPFTQQILSFKELPTQVPGVHSSVTRSQDYDNQSKGINGVGNVISPTRDGRLQAAVISGLYDLVQAPPFSCPGSNCTYPTFTSLGVGNQCFDVTSQTEQHCKQTNSSISNQICNYTLPSGAQLGAYASIDAHNGFMHTIINATTRSTIHSDKTTPVGLVNVSIITFGNNDLQSNSKLSTDWQKTLKVYECRYELCALAYSNWSYINSTVVPGSLHISPLNRTGGGPIIPHEALDNDFPGNKTFLINYYDLALLSSTLSVFNPDLNGQDRSYLQALYNSPNLTRTMDNIAEGLSYRILSGPNATAVEGEVFAMQTYINVHYPWLALTISLILLACTFFFTVVVQTERAHQRAWKSSLAPLLYGDVAPSLAETHVSTGEVGWPGGYEASRTRTIVSQLR